MALWSAIQGASVLEYMTSRKQKNNYVYKALGETTYSQVWVMKDDLEFGTDGIRGTVSENEFLRSLPQT